jgi:hypothetical protein
MLYPRIKYKLNNNLFKRIYKFHLNKTQKTLLNLPIFRVRNLYLKLKNYCQINLSKRYKKINLNLLNNIPEKKYLNKLF